MHKNYHISTASECLRIDRFLSEKTEISRSEIKKNATILVNEKSVKLSYILRINDNITFTYNKEETTLNLVPEDIPLDIVYEDKYIAVINKPIGMSSHLSDNERQGTLVNAILFHIKDIDVESFPDKSRIAIAHRLDKKTSGLMIIGKSDKIVEQLQSQFKIRAVKKIYHSVVTGVVNYDYGVIDRNIERHPKYKTKMRVVESGGRESVTHYKVLERLDKHTLVELNLKTGRTHQIRVHMASERHPVVGDEIYSKSYKKYALKGLALVSKYLEFTHPSTNKKMSFEINYPDEFSTLLNSFRN